MNFPVLVTPVTNHYLLVICSPETGKPIFKLHADGRLEVSDTVYPQETVDALLKLWESQQPLSPRVNMTGAEILLDIDCSGAGVS